MAFVFHISHVSGVSIYVVADHLTATVGQIDEVLSLGVISFTVLVVTKVQVSVVVLDGVVEIVVGGSLRSKGSIDLISKRQRSIESDRNVELQLT